MYFISSVVLPILCVAVNLLALVGLYKLLTKKGTLSVKTEASSITNIERVEHKVARASDVHEARSIIETLEKSGFSVMSHSVQADGSWYIILAKLFSGK